MTALPFKNFSQFVSDIVAAWAASIGFQPTLQPGDSLYALMESVSAQYVFIQAQIQIVNELARNQTSNGADLDSWMAQFDFPRLPATFDSGPVTFTKYTPAASPVVIPVGMIVQTPGGAIVYTVVADPSQPTWNAVANGYVLAMGQTSLTATVQASVAGTSSNVLAGQLSQIVGGSSTAGVDAVTNGAAIANALNAESDTAYRARFVLWLNSLSKAIKAAIESAIQNVQQGIRYSLQENVNISGAAQPGEFVVTIDDGSGSPPASLVNNVQVAVNAVRGFTILAEAIAVSVDNITISLAISIASGYVAGNVQAAVQTAIVNAVNAYALGGPTMFISFIEGIALSIPGCASVQPNGSTKINSSPNDLNITLFQSFRTSSPSVTVGIYT